MKVILIDESELLKSSTRESSPDPIPDEPIEVKVVKDPPARKRNNLGIVVIGVIILIIIVAVVIYFYGKKKED